MTGGPTIDENFAKKHKILLEKNVFFVEKSRFPTKKAEIFSKKKCFSNFLSFSTNLFS